MARRGLNFLLVFAVLLSCVALAYLALVGPPASSWWRVAGLLALGVGAGLLNVGLFHAVSRDYSSDVAGTIVSGGIWYGLGCLAATLLAWPFYNVASILLFMAIAPAVSRRSMPGNLTSRRRPADSPRFGQALQDFRSPGAVLFALLLFFQFGNEWSIAGWLPLLLIRRVGLSPKAALLILALYWFFLMTGRVGVGRDSAARAPRPPADRQRALSRCSAA